MKFYIETYGCTTNKFDSEALAGQLLKEGHELSDEKDADLVIINSCTVINTTEQKILDRIRKIRKPLLVAGCMPQVQSRRILRANPNASLLGAFALSEVCGVAEGAVKGDRITEIGRVDGEKTGLPCYHFNEKVVPVVISQGCLGNCSYCITRFARGELKSFSPESIVRAVRRAVESGAREIQLTSQDNGAYGTDIGADLAELLHQVTQIPGGFRVRVGMMNPSGALKILPRLINAYESEKIKPFLHVPVQSGSDRVLRDMGRGYCVEDFEQIVREFRKKFPGISVSTDVIVGYPTESDDDFQQTLELLKRVKPEVLNITRYSPRPGAESAGLKNLDSKIVKDRSRIVSDIQRKG